MITVHKQVSKGFEQKNHDKGSLEFSEVMYITVASDVQSLNEIRNDIVLTLKGN